MKIGQHRNALARRLTVLFRLIQIGFLLVAFSYWWVQVAEGEYYREMADNNRLRKVSLEAPRGLIYDRHGRQLVENVPSYSLFVDPSLSRGLEESFAFAAAILGTEPGELRERFRESRAGRFQQVRIAEDLDLGQVARFGVEQLEHPEFEIVAEHLRLSRYAHHTAHLLGYLGKVTPADLEVPKNPYRRDDLKGKEGIEGRFESRLRGTHGEQLVVVDNRGRLIEELEPRPARPGKDLYLTLDLTLQQEAARQLDGKMGAVVALDPRQGDVLALVSSPAYDPNAFVRGLDPADWRKLSQDPRRPLQNRALLDAAPGSIFKIVLALSGLKRGLIDLDSRVFCRGSVEIYGHRRRCWRASGHGWENLHDALRDSCDVYFYTLGQKLGIEAIAEDARLFGLGRVTGLELGGERAGLVPDGDWSRRVRGTPWFPGETISVAIGQGPILVTPLQMAVLMGAVARGHLVQPRLVLPSPDAPEEGDVPAGPPLPFAPEYLEAVRQGLWGVVNEPGGTGKNARIEGWDVAGKTGTAQVVRQETWTDNEDLPPELRDHAWFASYAPAEDPRLVVVVFVEHGGGGSKAAAPIAKAIYEKFFDDLPADPS